MNPIRGITSAIGCFTNLAFPEPQLTPEEQREYDELVRVSAAGIPLAKQRRLRDSYAPPYSRGVVKPASSSSGRLGDNNSQRRGNSGQRNSGGNLGNNVDVRA